MQTSADLYAQAGRVMPGGVNSPVRSFGKVGGHPFYTQRAEGAMLYTVDGTQLIDYVGAWGPMLLGHAYAPVVQAVQQAAQHAFCTGTCSPAELLLAQQIQQLVPQAERVRLLCSGTEACMTAIRVARAYTGRTYILKFDGGYHGHADDFLVAAGSGMATLGIADSAGALAGHTLVVPYNDLPALDAVLEAYAGQLAAIIVEPVCGNMGCVPPQPGFLAGLRQRCTTTGALLIFDEVMTGFRLALGGAQELFDCQADLITLGKIVGGGMPLAALAGPARFMDLLAPAGPVYQAGTMAGHPLACVAGSTQLQAIRQLAPGLYTTLDERARALASGLRHLFDARGIQQVINQQGSMLSLHFGVDRVHTYSQARQADAEAYGRFFRAMLALGVFIPPPAYESWFLSTCHTDDLIDKTLNAAEKALYALRAT